MFLEQATKSYILPIYDENELPWLMEIKSLKSSTSFEKTLDSVGVQYRKFFTSMCSKVFKSLVLFEMKNTNEFLDKDIFTYIIQ